MNTILTILAIIGGIVVSAILLVVYWALTDKTEPARYLTELERNRLGKPLWPGSK
jgi:hypothetical protein